MGALIGLHLARNHDREASAPSGDRRRSASPRPKSTYGLGTPLLLRWPSWAGWEGVPLHLCFRPPALGRAAGQEVWASETWPLSLSRFPSWTPTEMAQRGHLQVLSWGQRVRPGSRGDRPVCEEMPAYTQDDGEAFLLPVTLQPQTSVQSLLPARDELITL